MSKDNWLFFLFKKNVMLKNKKHLGLNLVFSLEIFQQRDTKLLN